MSKEDASAGYLTSRRAYFLAEAGLTDELRAQLLDLGWIVWMLEHVGLAELDAELARLADDATVREVRAALSGSAHLLAPLESPGDLTATVLLRLSTSPALLPIVRDHAIEAEAAWLGSAWRPRASRPERDRVLFHAGTPVDCVTVLGDGARLAVGGKDNRVHIYDVPTGDVVHTLTAHKDVVSALAGSPGGTILVSGGRDGTLTVWDTDTGDRLRVLIGHQSRVGFCAFTGDRQRLVTASDDATFRVWDCTRWECLLTLRCQEEPDINDRVSALVVDPSGSWIAAQVKRLGYGTTTYVWDAHSGRSIPTRDDVHGLVAWPPRALGSIRRGEVVLWDPLTGRTLATLKGLGPLLASVSRFGNRARALVTGRDRIRYLTACIADPRGAWIATVEAYEERDSRGVLQLSVIRALDYGSGNRHQLVLPGPVTTYAVSPDGSWLALGFSGSGSSEIRVWSPRTGTTLRSMTGGGDAWADLIASASSPNGDWIATADRRGALRIWEVRPPAAASPDTGPPTGHTVPMMRCAVGPAGAWLATTGSDRMVHIWDTVTGQRRHTLRSRERVRFINGYKYTCVVGPDAAWLATADDDGTVYIWDPDTGRRLHTCVGHTSQINVSASPSRGGPGWLATLDREGCLCIWDPGTGKALHRSVMDDPTPTSLAAHPTGRWLAVGGGDGVQLWDPHGGALVQSVTLGRSVTVNTLAVSPEGSWLVAGGGSGVQLWNPHGESVARLGVAEQAAPVHLLAVSPDASWVAAIDSQHRIHSWDPANGQHLGTLTGHTAGITMCAPSPDSKWLATTSADHTVRIWDLRHHRPATVVRVDGHPDDIAWLPSARQFCVVGRHGTHLFDWYPQP